MKALYILTFTLFLLTSSTLTAQKRPNPKKFEFEMGLNHSFAASRKGAEDMNYRVGVYLEGRFNLNKVPIALGFQLSTSNVRRVGMYNISNINFYIASLSFIGDYYFGRGKKVNPFIGVGIGCSFHNRTTYTCDINWDCTERKEKFFIMLSPRVGVKFFNRFTVSFDYIISDSYLSRMHARIGYYF